MHIYMYMHIRMRIHTHVHLNMRIQIQSSWDVEYLCAPHPPSPTYTHTDANLTHHTHTYTHTSHTLAHTQTHTHTHVNKREVSRRCLHGVAILGCCWHTAKHWNTLQHTATRCNTYCNTHCNTHRNTLQYSWEKLCSWGCDIWLLTSLQHTATHCNQHTVNHCTTLQHAATELRRRCFHGAMMFCCSWLKLITRKNSLLYFLLSVKSGLCSISWGLQYFVAISRRWMMHWLFHKIRFCFW